MKLRSILYNLFRRKEESTADTSPQKGISLSRYLGRWYEQARYENWFEAGLDEVFTDYSAGPSGSINILNCGRNGSGRQSTSKGRGFPQSGGLMKVSFVPPYAWFRASYHILYVDQEYRTALVSGQDSAHLWLLTRERIPSTDSINNLLAEARKRGFDLSRLRFTRQ